MQRAARLKRELQMLANEPPHGVTCWLVEDSACELEAQVVGQEGTPYHHGIFKLLLHLPERYPFEAPKVRFSTPIYHPNIDTGGRICLDILKPPPSGSWKPSMNISSVLTSILLLMAEPNPDDPLMVDISTEFKQNRAQFSRTACEWTKKFASGQTTAAATMGVSSAGTSSSTADGTRDGSRQTSTTCTSTAGAAGTSTVSSDRARPPHGTDRVAVHVRTSAPTSSAAPTTTTGTKNQSMRRNQPKAPSLSSSASATTAELQSDCSVTTAREDTNAQLPSSLPSSSSHPSASVHRDTPSAVLVVRSCSRTASAIQSTPHSPRTGRDGSVTSNGERATLGTVECSSASTASAAAPVNQQQRRRQQRQAVPTQAVGVDCVVIDDSDDDDVSDAVVMSSPPERPSPPGYSLQAVKRHAVVSSSEDGDGGGGAKRQFLGEEVDDDDLFSDGGDEEMGFRSDDDIL